MKAKYIYNDFALLLCVESDGKNGHSFSCEAKANVLYLITEQPCIILV